MKSVGIDMGGTSVRCGIVTGGELSFLNSIITNASGSRDEIISDIISLIEKTGTDGVGSIGIGVPSVVDSEKGIVYDVQNIPSWQEVPLKEILESRFNVPVFVNNDANCFILGEKYFGKAKDYRNAVGITLGTGLGVGIVIDDKLYNGRNSGAGEFGTAPYKDKTYEYYCSGQFFKQIYKTAGSELSVKASANDPEALRIFDEFGSHLGEAVKLIMYALDPDIIVLGGSVSGSFRFFQESLMRSIGQFYFKNSLKNFKLEVSGLKNAAVFGASSLAENFTLK